MAPESSSHSDKHDSRNWKYDVFLNFRGEDTRKNFLSHLYEALLAKGIFTFKDDVDLRKGESISPSLTEAIKASKLALVLFSKNYANSSWCLDELVHIIECRNTKKQTVLPVFYDVDPSDILNQTGFVATAFEEHERKFDTVKIKSWRNALSTVASISGWDSGRFPDDVALIDSVVNDFLDKLICIESKSEEKLVGIDSHMTEIDKLLGGGYNNARIVGIWGLGGVGKSAIADTVYRREKGKFDACYRLKDIQHRYRKDGAIALLKEFISQIFPHKDLNTWDVGRCCDVIRTRFQNTKALLVLDDIDESEQLELLANIQWFGQGSRIIVTTRDKRLLNEHDVKHIYEVPTLENNQSLQLFSLHAFKNDQPPQEFLELSKNFVSYTQGLPLVLKILGGSFYDRKDAKFWQSELEKFRRIRHPNIYHALRSSYDKLHDAVKKVFLDIAFFCNGMTKSRVENVLSDYCPISALEILEEKALLSISSDDIICMHGMVREMGHEVVREESKGDPSKRSRLRDPKDIHRVLKYAKGTEAIEGMTLNMSEIEPVRLKPYAFRRMNELRHLDFYMPWSCGRPKVQLLEDLNFLPNQLTYFRWDFFPAKSFPPGFSGQNLVEFRACGSNLEYLKLKKERVKKLRLIHLSYSKRLKALPELPDDIEEIVVEGCENLVELPSDLSHLRKLRFLNMSGCKKLDKLPKLPPNLKRLNLSGTAITELPSVIQLLTELEELRLYGCSKLTTLRKEDLYQLYL